MSQLQPVDGLLIALLGIYALRHFESHASYVDAYLAPVPQTQLSLDREFVLELQVRLQNKVTANVPKDVGGHVRPEMWLAFAPAMPASGKHVEIPPTSDFAGRLHGSFRLAVLLDLRVYHFVWSLV